MVWVIVLEKTIGPPSAGYGIHTIFRMADRPPRVTSDTPWISILIREKRRDRKGSKHCIFIHLTPNVVHTLVISRHRCSYFGIIIRVCLYNTTVHEVHFHVFKTVCGLRTQEICHSTLRIWMCGVHTISTIIPNGFTIRFEYNIPARPLCPVGSLP